MNYQRAHIEISNICNVQCSFCPIVDRPKEIMELSKIAELFKKVAPLAKDVCLHLMGEPLAHPEIVAIIKVAEESNLQLQITTNGLLIKKYGHLLIESPAVRQVNFSLQAFKDNFPNRPIETYLDPIIQFTEMSFRKRESLYINFRLWNFGAESFLRNEEIISYLEREMSFSLKRSVDVGGIKSKKVFDDKRLYFHFDSRFEWPSLNLPKRSNQGTCQGLRNHFGIHADGTVVPCCLDKEADIPLGNAFEKDLISILDGERATKIRKGFEEGRLVEDLCRTCSFIDRFAKAKKKMGN